MNLFPRMTDAIAALDAPGSFPFNNGLYVAPCAALGRAPPVPHEPGRFTAYEKSGALFSWHEQKEKNYVQ